MYDFFEKYNEKTRRLFNTLMGMSTHNCNYFCSFFDVDNIYDLLSCYPEYIENHYNYEYALSMAEID